MACGCTGKPRSTFRKSSEPQPRRVQPSASAAQRAVESQHEVIDASGRPTGRKFTSLVAASSYAKRIGGKTRPA